MRKRGGMFDDAYSFASARHPTTGETRSQKLGRPRRPWLQLPAWSEWTRLQEASISGAPCHDSTEPFAHFLSGASMQAPAAGEGAALPRLLFFLSFFSRRPSQKSLLLRGWVLLLHEHLFSHFTHPPFLLHIWFNRRRILDLGQRKRLPHHFRPFFFPSFFLHLGSTISYFPLLLADTLRYHV